MTYKAMFEDGKPTCFKNGYRITEEELLEYLRQFYKDNGRVPKQKDFPRNSKYPGFKMYVTIFGNWNIAIAKAGFKPRTGGNHTYTDEELKNYLVQFYEENKRSPMAQDFIGNPKYPYFSTFIDRLGGSWNKALMSAGLPVNRFTNLTREELLDYLKKFYQENNRPPTTKDFTDNDKYPSFGTYFLVFGSWQNSLKSAGLPVNRFTDLTIDELLDYLIDFNKENGRPPTEEDFRNNFEYPHSDTYRNIFGSWSEALRLVELDVDSMVNKGIIRNTNQKARLGEILILEHLGKEAIDLSGKNCNSPIDGICPKKQLYDAKSSHLYIDKYWNFNLDKENMVDFYYLLAFNENWTKLLHIWRIAWNFIEGNYLRIGSVDHRRYVHNIENMKEYEITDKFRKIKKFEILF